MSSQPLLGSIQPKSEKGRKQAQNSPGTLHTICVGGVKFPRVVVVVLVGGGGEVTLIHRKKNQARTKNNIQTKLDKDVTYLCDWVSDVLFKINSPVSETVSAQE